MARPTEEVVLWAAQDVTLPALAGPNKALPINDLINKGWDMNQKPAADEFNYLLNNYAKWLIYLDEKSGGASPDAPEVDSLPSTTPLRDTDGKGCFKGIKASNTTNANAFNMIDTYNSKTAVSVSIDGNEIGNFVYNGLLASGDGRSGLACNTAGIHYGNVVGNADTATKLATPRTIRLRGALIGDGVFDGSSNLTINTALNNYTFDTSSTGYLFLPNPNPSLTSQLLIVWGTFQGDTGTPYTGSVAFPVTFPNQCFGVNFHTNDVWSSGDGNDQVAYDITKNGFTYRMEAANRKHFYIAIGC